MSKARQFKPFLKDDRLTWVVALGLCCVALVAGFQLSPFAKAAKSTLPVEVMPPSDNGPSAGVDDEAAAFAARALARAGLLDPSGTLYGLSGAAATPDGGWEFTFGRSECYATEVVEGCNATGDSAAVTVRVNGNSFVVTQTSGLSMAERHTVESYQEERRERQPGWTFPQVIIHQQPGGPHIEGAPVWEGPVGAPGLGSRCHGGTRDPATGRVLWETERTMDIAAPRSADGRLGMVLSLGSVPQKAVSGEPFILCDSWTGGWSADRGAEAAQGNDSRGQAGFYAHSGLVWKGDPFEQAFSECVFTVEDSDGETLGTATETIPPPLRGPSGRSLEITTFVPVENPSRADSAKVACNSITSEEFEQGGSR